MPELPEVETVKRGLEPYLVGETVVDVFVYRRQLRELISSDFEEIMRNRTVVSLQRRAKILIIKLSGKMNILLHLGMSGTCLYCDIGTVPAKHTHVVIRFQAIEFHFTDPRRFGFVLSAKDEDLKMVKYLRDLGPEPLGNDFSVEYLTNSLSNRGCNVKNAIMNNKIVVGVGNIYASESLFLAGIHPASKCSKISMEKLSKLVNSIRLTLASAIESGGSSLKDHKKADGGLGYFQHNFNVYGRNGEKCCFCGGRIEKIVQSGCATYLCNECQFFYE